MAKNNPSPFKDSGGDQQPKPSGENENNLEAYKEAFENYLEAKLKEKQELPDKIFFCEQIIPNGAEDSPDKDRFIFMAWISRENLKFAFAQFVAWLHDLQEIYFMGDVSFVPHFTEHFAKATAILAIGGQENKEN